MEFNGLSEAEVKRLTAEKKTNRSSVQKTKTVADIIRSNVCTFFNLIFAVLFGLILITGQIKHTAFIFVVVFNTLIGIIQEIRAKRTIDKLSILNAAKASVIREGKSYLIDTEDVVEGETVILSAGEQIYADGEIIGGKIDVNEALLTGEADDIKKETGSRVLSGSFVTSGTAYCRLTAVGDASFAAKTVSEVKKYKKVYSEITSAFDKIIKTVGIAIIPLGLLLFFRQWLSVGLDPLSSIEKTAAAIIGMIPEGLYLLTSIALALSVIKLGKANVLVQDLYAIEALARVDVLCVDKTGTVTTGRMTVRKTEDISGADISGIMQNIAAESPDENFTAAALSEYFGKEKTMTAEAKIPFSSERKWAAYIFGGETYILGAPEFILHNAAISEKVNKYAEKGYRVLLLAKGEVKEEKILSAEPLSLIIIEDILRDNVKETFSFFRENGVEIKMISGDDPKTASEIARRAGISGYEKYIDLSDLTEEEVKAAAAEYNVFGRVKPEQKRIIVQALKDANKTPAMVGDGVNDVLALREASCSIAMAQGSEAAKRVSNLVLMDSDFNSVPNIIFEGRRVINNISRSSSLFIVKTLYSIAITFLLLFLPFAFPYEPIQLTLVSTVTIGLPSFILALEPDTGIIRGNFIKNTFAKALPSAAATVLSVIAVLTVSYFTKASHAETATASILIMGFIGFVTVFRACKPFTKLRKAMFAAMTVIFVSVALICGRSVLEFAPLPNSLLITDIISAAIVIPAINILYSFITRIFGKKEKRK